MKAAVGLNVTFIWTLWPFVAVVGCGGSAQGSSQTMGSTDASAERDDGDTRAEGATLDGLVIDTAQPDVAPHSPWGDAAIVDGSGSCEPYPYQGGKYAACCNGSACAGLCVDVGGGQVECQCMGIQGGCPLDQVCCFFHTGCVPAVQCNKGH
jgi:hypothetical protein